MTTNARSSRTTLATATTARVTTTIYTLNANSLTSIASKLVAIAIVESSGANHVVIATALRAAAVNAPSPFSLEASRFSIRGTQSLGVASFQFV